MSPHTIVFIRHAHRDTSVREDDNGLDEKGIEQVRELLKLYKKEDLPQSEIFLTSPKKRCVETLTPLAHSCNQKIKIVRELDEQHSDESGSDFQTRIHHYLHKNLLKQSQKVIYCCSHGDVLPIMIDELTGQWVDVKKGRAIVCINKNEGWHLK